MALISFGEALDKIVQTRVAPLGIERIYFEEALNRVLAEDVLAVHDDPLYPTAAMDGYAIRHADLEMESLQIMGDNPAGGENALIVESGMAVKTFTGSLMPEGSDTLVPVEHVSEQDGRLHIEVIPKMAANVRQTGESYQEGDRLLSRGTKIGPVQIGLLASLNRITVPVFQKPKVGLISFGNELLELGEERVHPGQIYSINNYALAAAIKEAGAEVVSYGLIKDDEQKTREVITEALEYCDVLVTTGGMSKGDYDYVQHALMESATDVLFKGVKLKPGKPVMVAQAGKKFIIGLPGFPVSSYVTFQIFGRPILERMIGLSGESGIVQVVLDEPVRKKHDRTELRPCTLRYEGGQYRVNFSEQKKIGSSAVFGNLSSPTALLLIEANVTELAEGQKAQAYLV